MDCDGFPPQSYPRILVGDANQRPRQFWKASRKRTNGDGGIIPFVYDCAVVGLVPFGRLHTVELHKKAKLTADCARRGDRLPSKCFGVQIGL
jgi:hypothetical protein